MTSPDSTAQASSRGSHALGEGTGSIFVHALAPEQAAGEPVAACGHPLNTGRPRLRGRAAEATSFETLVRIDGNPGCPDCTSVLGLTPWQPDAPAARGAGATASGGRLRQAGWAKIGALAVTG